MPSVASGGTAERIVARIVFKVLRAGSETAARYLSTSFEPLPLCADGRRFVEVAFFVGIAGVSLFQCCGIPLVARYAMSAPSSCDCAWDGRWRPSLHQRVLALDLYGLHYDVVVGTILTIARGFRDFLNDFIPL